MHFHEINLGYFSIEIKWLHSVPIIVIITHYLILSSVCLQPSFMITERPKIIMIINIHCRRGPVHLIHTGVSCGLDFPGRAWSLSRTWPSRWQTEYRQYQECLQVTESVGSMNNTNTLFSTMSTDNGKHYAWSFRVKEWSQHDKRKTGELLLSHLLHLH